MKYFCDFCREREYENLRIAASSKKNCRVYKQTNAI